MTNMENSAGYKKLTFWERNKLSRVLDNLRRVPVWNFSDEDFQDIIQ